jgi:hypothetical protein
MVSGGIRINTTRGQSALRISAETIKAVKAINPGCVSHVTSLGPNRIYRVVVSS